MASNRLPGKVLKEICGKPMLAWVHYRVKKATNVKKVVVATTSSPKDDLIQTFCEKNAIDYFRGSEFDVLERFYQAAKNTQAGIIVRITADCPLIDPNLIDQCVSRLIDNGLDFVANRLPPPFIRTFPIGLDVEVVTFNALERAWDESQETYQREHVMPFFYEEDRGFHIEIIDNAINYGQLRWTVDTDSDLEFVNAVVKLLHCQMDFSWLDVLSIVKKYPELEKMNLQEHHKSFKDVDDRLHSNKQ